MLQKVLIACCIFNAAFCLAVEEKPIAPEAAAQKEAEKMIRDLFKDEYARRAIPERIAFSRKLIKQGVETSSDAAARYVLLREARDIACESGEAALALSAIAETARFYAINEQQEKTDALSKCSSAAKTPESAAGVTACYMQLVDEAVAADKYDLAHELCGKAESVARRTQNAVVLTDVQARGKEVREFRDQYQRLKDAVRTTLTAPDDPAANLEIGKFCCLVKNDWKAGVPMLAKGNDAALKAAAEKDAADPQTAEARAAAGDAWWEIAAADKSPAKSKYQRRAAYWYERAVPDLAGILKTKIEKRLQELSAGPAPAANAAGSAAGSGYLSDMPEREVVIGWGKFGKKGMGYEGKKISVGGAASPNGIAMHPPAKGIAHVAYYLDRQYRTFKATAAIDDQSKGAYTRVTFKVIGDGKTLWESKPIKHPGAKEECSVSVAGVQKLELVVDCPGDNGHAMSVWMEPQCLKN